MDLIPDLSVYGFRQEKWFPHDSTRWRRIVSMTSSIERDEIFICLDELSNKHRISPCYPDNRGDLKERDHALFSLNKPLDDVNVHGLSAAGRENIYSTSFIRGRSFIAI